MVTAIKWIQLYKDISFGGIVVEKAQHDSLSLDIQTPAEKIFGPQKYT